VRVARPRLLDDEMAGRLVPQVSLLPVEIQLPLRGRTVPQVQIDETLIRNANVFRNGLEVRDGLFIEPNGDLLLELRCIGILSCSGEVVLFAHVAPLRIEPGFLGCCLASRDEANDVAYRPDSNDKRQAAEASCVN